MKPQLAACASIAVLGLAGCSGGGSGGLIATPATGVFKDSNVSGLSFASGSVTGITGTNGSYSFSPGGTTTFSVGAVSIGSATGEPTVTPIDLIGNGTSSDLRVLNITRFLMMLDTNGNPSDGITISAAVQNIAKNWTQVDFSTADLQTELASIISDAATADNTSHPLPDAATAKAHLEGTFLCTHSGAFRGTFSSGVGGDNGPLGIVIDAKTGSVGGVAINRVTTQLRTLTGASPLSIDQQQTFVVEDLASTQTFSGRYSQSNTLGQESVNGTWQIPQTAFNGVFSGTRVGGSPNALYRFSGSVFGGNLEVFALDVDTGNHVTGSAYSVETDQATGISGTVSGTALSATVTDGTTITGTLDESAGSMSGNWVNNSQSIQTTFSGTGCQLN